MHITRNIVCNNLELVVRRVDGRKYKPLSFGRIGAQTQPRLHGSLHVANGNSILQQTLQSVRIVITLIPHNELIQCCFDQTL